MMATLLMATLLASCSARPQRTLENLQNAEQSEDYASLRYIRYAEQAQKEGYRNIANLLIALAHSEYVQAEKIRQCLDHYDLQEMKRQTDTLFAIGTTLENLQFAVDAKTYKNQTAYPIFTSTATNEQAYPIEELFRRMTLVAHYHAGYCSKAIEILCRDHTDINVVNSWSVCPQCGCVYITACSDEHCDICGEAASTFLLFQ